MVADWYLFLSIIAPDMVAAADILSLLSPDTLDIGTQEGEDATHYV